MTSPSVPSSASTKAGPESPTTADLLLHIHMLENVNRTQAETIRNLEVLTTSCRVERQAIMAKARKELDGVNTSISAKAYLSMIEGIDTQEALLVRTVEAPPPAYELRTTSPRGPPAESYVNLLRQQDELTIPKQGRICLGRGKKRLYNEIAAPSPTMNLTSWCWPAALHGWPFGSWTVGDSESTPSRKRARTEL